MPGKCTDLRWWARNEAGPEVWRGESELSPRKWTSDINLTLSKVNTFAGSALMISYPRYWTYAASTCLHANFHHGSGFNLQVEKKPRWHSCSLSNPHKRGAAEMSNSLCGAQNLRRLRIMSVRFVQSHEMVACIMVISNVRRGESKFEYLGRTLFHFDAYKKLMICLRSGPQTKPCTIWPPSRWLPQ
jgi:hypothetical protein